MSDTPPDLDTILNGVPQEEEEEDAPPVRTPIGFDRDTAVAILDGDSRVPTELTYSYERDLGARRFRPDPVTVSGTQELYYDAGLDDLISNFGPERTREIQTALVQTGLLSGSSVITFGEWDNGSVNAFKELLGMSNRSGTVWQDTLGRLLSNPSPLRSGGGGGGGASRAPFQARIPDRDEVRRSYRSVASRLLGGNFVSDEEADAFADSFTQQVVSAQRQAYNGQTINEAPSLEAETVETLETTREDEVDANRFAGYVKVLEELTL